MAKNFASPQQSPRDEVDINGSTYALQIALRNMKERYHKLQRKLSFIEEENQRLVHGKTELFGEIGLMQENSIKLREKNLQLNQEIHSKHQENCSLRDSYNSLTQQNAILLTEKKKLQGQVTQLLETNKSLQDQVQQLSSKTADGPAKVSHAEDADDRPLSPDSITPQPIMKMTGGSIDESHSEDSIDDCRKHQSSSGAGGSVTGESLCGLFEASEDVSDRMDAIMDEVQRQNCILRELLPALLTSQPLPDTGGVGSFSRGTARSNTSTAGSQRDRDLSTLTVCEDNQMVLEDGRETGDVYNSRLATCGSVLVEVGGDGGAAAAISKGGFRDDHWRVDATSTGLNKQRVVTGTERPNSPFDWRKVKLSDDEVSPSDDCSDQSSSDSKSSPNQFRATHHQPPPVPPLPHGQTLAPFEDDAKICPMCNQSFSRDVTQDMFENHVVAHFEDINVGFEIV